MEIKNTSFIGGVGSAASKAQSVAPAQRSQSDSVSTADADRAAAMARAVQSDVGLSRAARLARVESAIREGTYQPSASDVAAHMVDAAEIDAQLQAKLRG
jgi:anti-sigma28 factor (negative regulator of flagellin synthesis)